MPTRPCTWPTPLADVHPDDLELVADVLLCVDASERHRANMRLTVVAFARWLAARQTRLLESRRRDCAEWFAARRDLVKPNTQVANWVHLKGFYRAVEHDRVLNRRGEWHSPMAAIPKPEAATYVRTKAARLDEYEQLLDAFDKRTALGLRDAAMCSLMFRSGLRVGELAQLDLLDLDIEARRLLLEHTKNDEPRRVPVHPETLTLLRRYLRRRGDRPGPLFANTERRGSTRLKTATIQTMFKRAATRAGVPLTPHTLRRGWYAEYIENGGDVVSAMHIAGWKREVMPYRYGADRRDDTAQAVFDSVAARQVQARRRLRAI